METLQKICLFLLIIGGINWGLIGILDFNLVETIFNEGSILTRIIYILVGISSLVSISTLFAHFVNKKEV